MKLATFLLCSLLFTSVYSKPVQLEDGEIESASKDIKDAEKFLDSLLANLDQSDAEEEIKGYFDGYIKFIREFVRLGPVSAIEIYERLSEIEELIHSATEIQSEGDDLKEVLRKVEKFEAVVKKYKDYQKAHAVSSVRSGVEFLEPIKNTINENPDNFLELVIENAEEHIFLQFIKTPRYLLYLIKDNLPKIFENLWVSELAIESVKSAHPSEAEQLKTILREVEAKILSLKRETKRVAMEHDLTKQYLKSSKRREKLARAREDFLQNNGVDIVYKRNKIVNEDEQEELVNKIIASIPTLDRVNSSFLEEAKYAVEVFKSEFPNDTENSTKLEHYLESLERYFNDFVDCTKTLAKKIELDTAEGVRTNPLYIDMFTRIVELKHTDMHMFHWGIYGIIEDVIHPRLPLGEEEIIDGNRSRAILFDKMSDGFRTLFNCTSQHRENPDPLAEYLELVGRDFNQFTPGLFPWIDNLPGLYMKYIRVGV